MEIIVSKNYDEMSKKVSDFFIKQWENIKVLGLATGSTPIGLYNELAKANKQGLISFKNIKTVNLDEYINLPFEHKESYHRFMNENLFSKVDIDINNTNVPEANDINDIESCKLYDQKIDSLGGIDIQVLGIGENGHIAFNEPAKELKYGTNIVKLTESTINANSRFFNSIDEVPKHAITMGVGKILEAKQIVLIANGAKKAEAMKKLIKGDNITLDCPVTLLKLHPNVHIFIDEELEKAIEK